MNKTEIKTGEGKAPRYEPTANEDALLRRCNELETQRDEERKAKMTWANNARKIAQERDELLGIVKAWQDWSEGKRAWPKLETNAAIAKVERQEKYGLWNEKTKSYILPSGTVKQGRRPMFKPFDDTKGDKRDE